MEMAPVDDLSYMESKMLRSNSTFLLSCPVREDTKGRLPLAVSLVADNGIRWIFGIYCQLPTNFLGIKYDPPGGIRLIVYVFYLAICKPPRLANGLKKPVAVCTRGLMFRYPRSETLLRLVEWLELLRLVKVDKVFLYYYEVHPLMMRVLERYQKQGLVYLTPVTLSGHRARWA